MKMTKYLLWFFIGLLSLGQLQRLELPLLSFYLHDIFIILWLLTHSFLCFTKKLNCKSSLKTSNSNKKIGGSINKITSWLKNHYLETSFLFLITLSSLFNLIINNDVLSILYVSRVLLYIAFALSLKNLVSQRRISSNYLRFQFLSFGLLILLLGFLQIIFLPDTRFLAVFGWDDHLNRLISTIFDPGFTGIILVITYLYFLSLNKATNIKYYLVTFMLFLGIALTFSRASYLSLIFIILSLPILQMKKNKMLSIKKYKEKRIEKYSFKKSIALPLLFLSLVLIIPKSTGEGVKLARTSTIASRTESLSDEVNSITLKTIIIGNGLFSKQNTNAKNHQGIATHSHMPDNILANLFLSTGIIGTILALILTAKYLNILYKLEIETTLAILTTILHAQFNNSLLQPFVLLLLLGGLSSIKRVKKIK